MSNTVLIFGGGSDERLVSVASGQNLARQFPFDECWFVHEDGAISRTTAEVLATHQKPFQEKFQPREKPFALKLEDALATLKDKMVFLGFHGTEGEDGTIQELFQKSGVKFTGSDAQASRRCFDKVKAKEIVAREGIAVAAQSALRADETFDQAMARMSNFLITHKKMILKPIANGSSVGLFIVSDREQLEHAVRTILNTRYGDYLAESFVQGRELTVGILHHEGKLLALPASEVVLNEGHTFDYEGKYLGRGSTEITPAKVTDQEMQAAKDLSLKAHQALGCYGYTRTDMILTSTGPIYLETNTLPGLTRASFLPQQLDVLKIPMKEFIGAQLELARRR